MKVLFIYPNICTYSNGFQCGIGSLSSVLKSNGHETSLLNITSEINKKQMTAYIDKIRPDLIAFSSVTNQYHYVKTYSKWIKEESTIPVLCGGIHATLCPEEVLSDENIDIVCVGEGEYAILELANRMEWRKPINDIQNLWIKGKPDKKNDIRPLIQDLDLLPFPDRELFNFQDLLRENGGIADLMAGRGCPYDCTYCCNHTLKNIYKEKGKYVRMRSVGNMIEEIECLLEKYKDIKVLNFNDDTFTLFPRWINTFCEAYAKKFDVPFLCNARVETLDKEILLNLKKAGCEQIRIGIESGNEWLREKVLKRKMKNEEIRRAFNFAHEVGIKTYSFNMFGLPFETPEMADETLLLNKLIEPDYIQASIFYPYPKTELYEICKKNDFLLRNEKDSYFDDGAMINSPGFPAWQISKYFEKAKELSFNTYVKTNYRSIYPFYRCSSRLIGPKNTEKALRFFKSKL